MNTFKRTLSMLLIVAMLLSCFPAAVFAAEAGNTVIQDLEVDQRTNPMGIDNLVPEFRWEMVSDVRGQKQTAYRIVVKDGDTTVWDTGKVESDLSNAIRYGGSALESATRYDWTVTVWDKDGNALESKSAWFEMGLLNESDWDGADFIAPTVEDMVDPMATDQYTIDFDFVINKDNQGFCFNMSDTSNFIMYQINTYDALHVNKIGDKVLLRPHFMAGGNWQGYPGLNGVQAVDITEALGVATATEAVGKTFHERLVVSGNNIKLYFGPAGTTADTPTEQLSLADDFTFTKYSSVPFVGIGFRHNSDGNTQEVASYDNFVARDNRTGEILYTNDFSSGKIEFSGKHLALENGWLKVGTTSTTGGEVRTVATKPALTFSAPMFRKEFAVKEGLVSARLYATSLGIYEAYVNGEKAGVDKMAPGWTDYKKYVQYQTYDITDMLQVGDNAIGAVVGNGWYSGYVSITGNNQYGTDEAFLGKIVLTYADGSVETIGTDATWQAYMNGPWVETDNQNGETYDARLEVPGWAEPNFEGKGWIATKIATSSTIQTEVKPESVALVAQPEEPVQEIEYLPARFLAKTGEDTYVYDLGQNISGVIRIHVRGEAGTTMKLRFGEMVYKDTNALYTANLRSAKATDYYTLKGAEEGETYQPALTFHGFRYFEVSGLGYQPAAEDIIGVVIHSKLDRTGYVETNNALVNQLFSNIIWGHRDNYLSIPTDCPQRDERMGWTGDASVFSRTASMNFDINAFYTKYIRDVYAASDGSNMPSIAPIEPHPTFLHGGSAWGDFAVIGPWTMYTAYGDTAILEEAWPYMTGWIRYYETTKAGSDYLCDYDQFGDHLAISESTDKLYSSSCYYAYVTGLMAKMAAILNKHDEAAYYTELAQNIRTAILNKYVNRETGVISSNSQTAYVLALSFDILPEGELREKAAANLVARIEAKDWHLSGGFIGIENLLPVLTEYGYNDVAYQLLLTETYPSWLYPVVNGATTMWERWNSYIAETGTFGDVSMNSFNHYSFGAVGAWMYQIAGGIQYDETNGGYKHFTIAPNPNSQLDAFKVTYESVYGEIVSDWTLKNGVFTLKASVPANTTATVVVPSDDEAALAVDTVEGVDYVGTEDGKATFEVVSGDYVFTSAVKERYTVTASGSAPGGTFVSTTVNGEAGCATVMDGTEAVIEATAVNAAEWEFVGWNGDLESDENPLTVAVTGNLNLSAAFRYVGKTNLALGKTVTSRSNAGNAPNFYRGGLVDGLYITENNANGWTSGGNASAAANEWVQIDLGAVTAVNEVHLYPRTDILAADGRSCSFPVDYTIQVSENGTEWKTVVTEVGHAAPAKGEPVFHTFDTVNARYVKLDATKLGAQPVGDANYRLQLAEMGVYHVQNADEYTLTVDGSGMVLVNGEAVTLPYTGTFAANTDVTVEAVDGATTVFDSWSGSVTGTEPRLCLHMSDNKTLTAHFTKALNLTNNQSFYLYCPNTLGAITIGDNNALIKSALPTEGTVESGKEWIFRKVDGNYLIYNRASDLYVTAMTGGNGGQIQMTPYVGDASQQWKLTMVTDEVFTLQSVKTGALFCEKGGGTDHIHLWEDVSSPIQQYTVRLAADLDAEAVDALIDAIGEVDHGSKEAIDAARAAYEALPAAKKTYVTKLAVLEAAEEAYKALQSPADDTVTLILSGADNVSVEDEAVTYTLSAKGMNALANAIVVIDLDETYLTDPTVTVAEGWYLIAHTWKNGVLNVAVGNLNGANGDGDILTVTAKPTGEKGSATVAVTYAELCAYDGEGEVFVNADLSQATVTTDMAFNPYDVNKDGVVDQRDMTRAQRFYNTNNADADVNDDNLVDIVDLILILQNYHEKFAQ